MLAPYSKIKKSNKPILTSSGLNKLYCAMLAPYSKKINKKVVIHS